jgi:hypothetical protein
VAANDSYDIGVIGILGPSYCGSTILSYVLNTDPGIFGGGELRRLVELNKTVKCDLCGRRCPYWTRKNIRLFAPRGDESGRERFYRKIAGIVGKRLIADSSKLGPFFTDEFIAAEKADGARFAFIVPVKHPIRFFASYVYNKLFRNESRKLGDFDEVRQSLDDPSRSQELESFLLGVGNTLLGSYRQFYNRFGQQSEGPLFTLKHEEFVGEAGQELLAGFVREGLGYDPVLNLASYPSFETHPVGGNRGPYWQAKLERVETFRSPDPRFRYYRERSGIRLDQKYRRIFSPVMIRRLLDLEITQELGKLLSYSDAELYGVADEPPAATADVQGSEAMTTPGSGA